MTELSQELSQFSSQSEPVKTTATTTAANRNVQIVHTDACTDKLMAPVCIQIIGTGICKGRFGEYVQTDVLV